MSFSGYVYIIHIKRNKETKMKKISIALTAVLLSFALTSCASNKGEPTPADDYDSEPVKINAPSDPSNANSKVSGSKQKKNKKTASDMLHDLVTFTNNEKYLRYDTTSLFTQEITGLKEKRAQTLIRLDEDLAGFGSYYMAAYYIVQFDEDARQKLAKAVENYLSDFENKRLQRKGKHTERTYGKISYRLDWGATSTITPNNGVGEGYLGYEFVKNSPYFVISNYPFENKYYERAGDATERESMTLRYFFTKAQARQLVELLSEEKINSQLSESNISREPTEIDEY